MTYEEEHYGKLTGKTIKAVVKDNGIGNDQCYGLQFTDGTIAWIMRDPEGNGPGFLDLQPLARK